MSLISFQLVPGIVARLRLVFLSVTLVLMGGMALGYFQLRDIRQNSEKYSAEVVPLTRQAHEIEQNLAGLLLALQRARSARNSVAFENASTAAIQNVQQLHDVADLLSELDPASQFVPEIASLADQAQSAVQTVLVLFRDMQRVRAVLEDSVNDLAQEMLETPDQETVDETANQRGNAMIRKALDKTVLQRDLEKQIDESLIEIDALISDISKNADQVQLGAARAQEEVSASLVNSSSQAVTNMAISGLFSIALVILANMLIVERQVKRRISRLNEALETIAADESALRVDIGGNDELGWMANALETFRTNAEDLRRSNTELENFAYVAAHDLRSPLRAIQDLAEWTMEDEESHLSEASQENMALLQKRVDRLNLLLSDLLTYSRVGLESREVSTASLPQLVRTTTEILDPNGKFDVTFSGDAHQVLIQVRPLRILLLNLIGNSIKHHDRARGAIHVIGNVRSGRLYLSVKDDGPGIEPQYHDRIFGLFQTLRPKDEVEGSGLGLAIIRKLAEHFGGKVRLLSDPARQRGATFEVELPVASDAVDDQDEAA